MVAQQQQHQPPEFKAPTLAAQYIDGRQELASTWVERLLLNLISYSIIILPIAFIVIATQRRLLPKSVRANSLIQWFVYGSDEVSRDHALKLNDIHGSEDGKRLLEDFAEDSKDRLARRQQAQPAVDVKSSTLEFIWCLVGLQVSYLIWGLLQERIMTTSYPKSALVTQTNRTESSTKDLSSKQKYLHENSLSGLVTFHDSQFLVFINRLVAFLMAMLALVYAQLKQGRIYANRIYTNGLSNSARNLTRSSNQLNSSKPRVPFYKYIYCSLSNILSSWSQYEALKYVNFPTQCLSKTCKVIPVMLMSRLMLRQRHPSSDYLSALLLALGMFIFMYNQPASDQHHRSNSQVLTTSMIHEKLFSNSGLLSGLIILSLYLTFDSFTSNWQQNLYSQYDISNWQMMAATNFYSLLLTLTSLAQLGSLRPTFQLLASSRGLMRDCLIMSVMSSVGQMFVYYTIKRFGSVLFAVIMTLRQFLSILMSILIFGHQLTLNSLIGLVLVFMVAAYQVYGKSRKSRAKRNNPINSNKSGANSDRQAQKPSDAFRPHSFSKLEQESISIDFKK